MDALPFGRKLNGGRRKAATAVLQWDVAAAAAGGRREQVFQPREWLREHSLATRCSGKKVRPSHRKCRGLRARCVCMMREMGEPNPVHYVGTKSPGVPGFSRTPFCDLLACILGVWGFWHYH